MQGNRGVGPRLGRGMMCLLVATATAAGPARAIESKEVVERAQQRYQDARDFSMEFTRTLHWKLTAVTDTVRGKVYFQRRDAFRFEVPEQVYTTDGKLVCNYSSVTNQTILEQFDPEDDSFAPRRLLVNIPKDSRSVLLGEEPVDGAACYKLRLTPLADDPLMREATIWVDRKEWMMRRLEYVDLNGNVIGYALRQFQRNTNLPARLFKFEPPPGSEVVDLREPRQ